jgi:hypothetical protein
MDSAARAKRFGDAFVLIGRQRVQASIVSIPVKTKHGREYCTDSQEAE